jgi:hypothetical protein
MNDGTAIMRSLVLWGIPFAIVLTALAYETDWGRDIDREATAPRPAPAAPVTVSLLPEYKIAGGVDARKETVDRVLFNPTRRAAPPAPATAGGAAGSMQKGQYALTGTTVTGNVATAFLREVKGGKSHTVHKGEALNGIVIAEVKSDYVQLKQGSEVEDLQLKIASGPKSTVQLAAPAPAVPGQPQPVRQAGAVPASGSGEPAPSGRAARAAAAAPPNAANPNAAPRTNGAVSVSEILAERRRAARAAAAAANQGGVQRAQ